MHVMNMEVPLLLTLAFISACSWDPSLSIFSLALSLPVPRWLSLYGCLSVTPSLSLYLSLSLAFSLCLTAFLPLSLSVTICVSLPQEALRRAHTCAPAGPTSTLRRALWAEVRLHLSEHPKSDHHARLKHHAFMREATLVAASLHAPECHM